MDITVENALKSDVDILYNLNKKLIDKYENINDIAYDEVLRWVYKKITTFIDDYKRIVINKETVGFFHFYYQREVDMFELDDFYILDKYQNQGIGSYILNDLLAKTKKPIFLYVFIKNKKAIALYKRHNFIIIENIKNSRYIMRSDIWFYTLNNL